MANPFRGEARITIGGEERTVAFTIGMLCDLQKRLGKSVRTCMARGEFEEAELRECLSAGLREPTTRIDQWMGQEPERLSEWMGVVSGAVLLAYMGPNPSKEKLDDNRPLLEAFGLRHPADKGPTTPTSSTSTETSSGTPPATA